MKRTLVAAAGFALFAASGLANAASWSVFVEPGIYGRVAIGGYAEPPMVVAPQPVMAVDNGYGQIVEEVIDPAYATDQPPVYLWVPEYQRLHWAQYSREYGAVGVPVYFVDDGWYRANVMRRNWTPEQRSWSQQQWLEQDRLARDRFERQRFEQQRREQQQRWNAQREWYSQQQQQQGRWGRDHERHGPPQGQDQIRWGSAQGYLPQQGNPGARPQPQPQPGGQGNGQWQHGGQWPQPGNGGGRPGAGNGAPVGNGNGNAGNGGYGGGNGGYAGSGGNAGNGGGNAYAGNGGNPGRGGVGGNAGQQPPSAGQPHGDGRGWQGGGQNAGERRGEDRGQDRGQREERRSPPERHGGFEHGRGGRDR